MLAPAVGVVSIAVYLAAPVGGALQNCAWFGPLALVTLTLAARLRRPAGRGPVALLLAGVLAYLGASLAWDLWPVAVGVDAPFPSPLDGVYLAAYLCFVAFVLTMWRRLRGPRQIVDRVELTDALILTLGLVTVVWVVAMRPHLRGGGESMAIAVALAYPVMTTLLFAVTVRLMLTGLSIRSLPGGLLLTWLACEVCGSVLYAASAAHGTFGYGDAALVVWMAGHVALGALAADRGLDALVLPSRVAPDRPVGLEARRHVPLVALLSACAVPLVLGLAVEEGIYLVAAAAVMTAAVTYRTALLSGDLRALAVGLDEAVARLSAQRDQLLRYQAIVDFSDDAIVALSLDHVITAWNPGAERLYGYSAAEAVGRTVTMLSLSGSAGTVTPEKDRHLAEHGHLTFETVDRRKDGSTVSVSVTVSAIRDTAGQPTSYVAIGRDITVQKAREAETQQASKLESLGRLSAGLAHEINTPIQFVGDNAHFMAQAYDQLAQLIALYRFLLERAEDIPFEARLQRMRDAEAAAEFDYLREEIPSAVRQTLEGVDRVATIVRAMKTFSHPGGAEHVLADLNEALTATATVTRHQLHGVASLALDLAPDLPLVRCSVAELNQVFLNLIVNAADAIEETGRQGTITVSTAPDGDDHVVVRISDTGPGIPAHVMERMFDPFFTTKEVGRGTGQGLALAHSVVREGHDGELLVDTVPGAGSSFTVRLPVAGRMESRPVAVPA